MSQIGMKKKNILHTPVIEMPKDKKKEKVKSFGMMDPSTMGNGLPIIDRETVFRLELTDRNILVSGTKT